MLFSSMIFLWIFLPSVLVINFFIGKICDIRGVNSIKAKNLFLLIASLIFYAWGGIYYLILISAVILLNYIAGICIDKYTEERRIVLFTAVLSNVLILGYFKYFNLLIHTVEYILGKEAGGLGLKEVILPIGISFFIFQAMSYVIDVYNGKAEVQKSFVYFALYVALFPQLIAGPIVQYKDVASQLEAREENIHKFVCGMRRFVFGLAKKVLIANIMGDVVDKIWATDLTVMPCSVAWLGMFAYTLQIYYDFSGYSDMAIGIGKMLGFEFRENFNMPYTSLSIKEFWRRWHISLSSWFRDYVYIPLGGSRVTNIKIYRNLFIVFLLTGIWHGANYTFFFWGVYYALFIIIERAFLGERLDRNRFKIINYLYTMIVVMVGWVIFRADNINNSFVYLAGLFRFNGRGATVLDYINFKVLAAFLIGVFLSCPLWRHIKEKAVKADRKDDITIASFALQMLLLVMCIMLLVSGSYNPFIYFQF